MKTTFIYLLLFIGTCITSSCSKWLEVNPEDRFTEEQIYSSSEGFYEAINGLYLGLSKDNLYGDKMTLTAVELLANRYHILESTSSYMNISSWNYNSTYTLNTFSAIWQQAYISIGNTNNFIKAIDQYSSTVLEKDEADILKGEALAIRAFVHFDMLRLFGPVYNSVDSTRLAIPYYKNLSQDVQSILPANEVMKEVLNDINLATAYLKNDGSLQLGSSNLNNARFNYVAALALKARVLQWQNNKTGAYNVAKEAISLTDNFKWVTLNEARDPSNPDRIYVNEMLFGIYCNNLYNNYDKYFSFELDPAQILSSGSDAFIKNIYESSTLDYRYTVQWKVPSYGVIYPTFFKFADITNKTAGYLQRFAMPLIRKSELYYIAAETAPTTAEGLPYLNAVRNNRGLSSLTTTTSFSNEIMKEYLKEFYGEGQMWYYYKRNRISGISSPNGTSTSTIPSNAWVIPLPLIETDNR